MRFKILLFTLKQKKMAVSGKKSRFWVWVTHACTYLPYIIWVPMLKSTFFNTDLDALFLLWCTRWHFFEKNAFEKNLEQFLFCLTEHTAERGGVSAVCCVASSVVWARPRRRWASGILWVWKHHFWMYLDETISTMYNTHCRYLSFFFFKWVSVVHIFVLFYLFFFLKWPFCRL